MPAVVNVSSRASEIGGAVEWVHYAASKGAVDTLTIGAARELAPAAGCLPVEFLARWVVASRAAAPAPAPG